MIFSIVFHETLLPLLYPKHQLRFCISVLCDVRFQTYDYDASTESSPKDDHREVYQHYCYDLMRQGILPLLAYHIVYHLISLDNNIQCQFGALIG